MCLRFKISPFILKALRIFGQRFAKFCQKRRLFLHISCVLLDCYEVWAMVKILEIKLHKISKCFSLKTYKTLNPFCHIIVFKTIRGLRILWRETTWDFLLRFYLRKACWKLMQQFWSMWHCQVASFGFIKE